MIEINQSHYLTLGLTLFAFAFAGCSVQSADEASSTSEIGSSESELAACTDADVLELLNVKVRDQAGGKAAALSPSQTLSVVRGHTYVITADLHDKDKDPNSWVDWPNIVLRSSLSKVTTEITSPQSFAILAGGTQEMEATFTVAADACTSTAGKLSLAPTATYGRCTGAATTYNLKVTAR